MQMDLLPAQNVRPVAAVKSKPSAKAKHMPLPAEPSADDEKTPRAFKTISEAADALGVPQHVLRFWESRFPQIRPLKLRGGRRYYRPEDMAVLSQIQQLLYQQGYTIKGARKALGKRSPAVSPPAALSVSAAPTVSERQQSQLAVIKQELTALRDMLKPYMG